MSDMLPMTELMKPAAPDPARPWPASPPEPGKVYSFTCPNTGAHMIAMMHESFLNYGTMMEGMRRSAAQLDSRCKELHAAHSELASLHNDLQQRHAALREKLRSSRLESMERKIVTPDHKPVRLKR